MKKVKVKLKGLTFRAARAFLKKAKNYGGYLHEAEKIEGFLSNTYNITVKVPKDKVKHF